MQYKNIQMEQMLEAMKPVLAHRDKVGYVAARNTRIISDVLTEYLQFKQDLIKRYGEPDVDENGVQKNTISLSFDSPNFELFAAEFEKIKNIEHEVELMKISYKEVIGILNGEEILTLDFMLEE